jgi:hypothetical protein
MVARGVLPHHARRLGCLRAAMYPLRPRRFSPLPPVAILTRRVFFTCFLVLVPFGSGCYLWVTSALYTVGRFAYL